MNGQRVKRPLPPGWRWAKLGELFDVQQGVAMSPERRIGIAPRPFLRTLNVFWGHIDLSTLDEMDFSEQEVARLRLEPGDLLVCEGGDVGRTAIWQGELRVCLHQNHIHRLRRRNDGVLPEFVMYWMQGAFQVFQSYGGQESRTTIPNLSGGRLRSFSFPLPPLGEQQRIAARLSEQMAVVDRARQAAQAQVEAAKALPSACLRQVFESEEAKRWPRKAFEEVAVLQRGYDLPSHQQVSGKYPVMTSSGMSGTHSQYKAKGPGVVTGRSGSIGRVHFVESHYWPHNTALFVREFKGNEPRYVFYLLQWLRLEGLSGGTGVPTLDRKTVHKVMVFHPDKERQLRIVAALDQQMSQAERLRQPAEARLEAVNALPGALLEQVFGGLEPPV